jgi:dihydropteroate synthase
MKVWRTTRFDIDLTKPRVMGIVNVTPDSFFDGGVHASAGTALAHCERLVREGADILDIGGESSRPGAAGQSTDDELARVLPVLRGALTLGVPVSVDTCKPEVMRAALDLGVDIVNDILALQSPGAIERIATHPACGVCLMHMRGEPRTMQDAPDYADVVGEVGVFLAGRVAALIAQGIAARRIVLDPGIGFGKRPEHNLALLAALERLAEPGIPVLIGISRKSLVGIITGRPTSERLAGSVAFAALAVMRGAAIIRAHDVAATVDAVKVASALKRAGTGGGST